MSELHIPALSLVVLIGASGSGKSTFAARHFAPFEVVSSDFCRGLVSDDVNDQSVSGDAFEVLDFIVGKRLSRGRLSVVDATNVQREARRQLVELAKRHDVLPVALVLDVPESVALARNRTRPDRDFGEHVVRRQREQLRRSIGGLAREGFRVVHVMRGVEEIEAATVVRDRLFNDLRDEHGPFDVIGDVHGCLSELLSLLDALGYVVERDAQGRPIDAAHEAGRQVVFVGDLVDRGPDSPGVLRLVMGMAAAGHAFAVPGNHENKLVRALSGRKVRVSHGLETTLAQLDVEADEFRESVRRWCDGLVSHLVLDDGRLVVAHAGLPERTGGPPAECERSHCTATPPARPTTSGCLCAIRGRSTIGGGPPCSMATRRRSRPNGSTGRCAWTPVACSADTSPRCVGPSVRLFRFPPSGSGTNPAVPSRRPIPTLRRAPRRRSTRRGARRISISSDVLGRRVIETSHHGRISVRDDAAAGALEVMSRFAMHPRWLAYLPPTMSPVETTAREGLLEHPDEAFAAYVQWGVGDVVCEEKHMGSRVVVLVCREPAVAARRFGADRGEIGAAYSRTGRSIFGPVQSAAWLTSLANAVTKAGLWDELSTDWLLLDAEVLPWSVKAQPLIREQYAAVGAAARGSLSAASASLGAAAARGLDVGDLLARNELRRANADAFAQAYRRYCWEVDGLEGVSLAPFQILASEGATWESRDHLWHLEIADKLVEADAALFRSTRRLVVNVGDAVSRAEGVAWWEELTAAGGEGMVVKPLANLTRNTKGLVQPGLKVRGREYLRIIYGPDYTMPEHLTRLRDRKLGHKRSLALREYALGLESLGRLVQGEPLWRVHEAVFAVLAMESEPVDPRL